MTMAQNTRIAVQYEGTRYHGWQRQKKGQTIQGKLEAVLETLAGEAVNVIGASRTDAGVHARAQVANFHTVAALDPRRVVEHCAAYLPEDIAVLGAQVVPERFHSRYLARGKRYVYRLCTRPVPDVFERRTTYHLPGELDVAAMRRAAALIVGSHDFASFCGTRSDAKSTVRTLEKLEVDHEAGVIRVVLEAPAFLLGMARIITGTLIEVGQGRLRVQEIPRILERAERPSAGFTAPPQGLCLVAVRYDPPWDTPPEVPEAGTTKV